jgi:hypothetical protein
MSPEAVQSFFFTVGSCLLGQSRRFDIKKELMLDCSSFPETISFYVGIVLACAILLRILRATKRQQSVSGVSKEFRSVT